MAERINSGKLKDVLKINDLIGVQVDSFNHFLQRNVPPSQRNMQGLHEVFTEVFPIESFDKNVSINYHGYQINDEKVKIVDCLKDGLSYSAPLYVEFSITNKDQVTQEKVYMGEMPIMTERGTFIINGAERVIISQLHRSPGICFERTRHNSGNYLYSYRIIPDRGSWLEVQFDIHDNIYIYLDRRRRRRKFLITTFLRAIGYESNREMLDTAHGVKTYKVSTLTKANDLQNYFTVETVVNSKGQDIIKGLEPLNANVLKTLTNNDINQIDLVYLPNGDTYLINCLQRDTTTNTDDALKEIYRRMRPSDPPTPATARQLLKRLFFDIKRYDLGIVGRFKINEKLGTTEPLTQRVLTKEDFMIATMHLIKLKNTVGQPDDIDHLGSRRVRTVGELLQNQCRSGLLRTERLIRERMTLSGNDTTNLTPNKLINPKAFASVIRDFFARNQLSQFMDQTNPLSELTNKRRLSALGPGGLSRDRAGFEVRDVHTSHYGRICPIETPEGPNIGLISSMALYSRINELGFLETPYRIVKDGIVSTDVIYLTADKEEQYVIAQANAPLTPDNRFVNQVAMARYKGDSGEHPVTSVQLMDVSPKQLVSAATGLIPFLEHDDANRALMGSNMQRQSVPLLIPDSPLVGTGLEAKVAQDSRAALCATEDGIVVEVQSNLIVTTIDGKSFEKTIEPAKARRYELLKFMCSNAGTCINQKPIVRLGDKVTKGQAIADGASTQNGELALGKNLLVAFMPWCGYNYEDAIVISEKVVQNDVLTSIHIDEFEIIARDTKLGAEEITRDIPNISEESLSNLDMRGVIRIGAEVKPGDILVGKITPKSETELAPEERLLRAIFGEKAADVKDSSLVVPSGKGGIVMDIRIEHQTETTRQAMTKTIMRKHVKQIKDQYKEKFAELVEELSEKLSSVILGIKLPSPIFDESSTKLDAILISANRKVTSTSINKLAQKWNEWRMDDCPVKHSIEEIINGFKHRFEQVEASRRDGIISVESGNPADLGAIRRVKIYIASKRKLEVGDKMAGRHGNKGIVAKIVPVQDMPFLPDGTPLDIVLNPMGVPSRMNVGQVLETHLGLAAKYLGFKIATPVFDGIKESQIVDYMRQANQKLSAETNEVYKLGFKDDALEQFDGKTDLYDGRTGEKFAMRVMCGYIYMMKLDHLVAKKIHARSVGPYSLVTQQPLGGKAQHGGQRFGEMEVWALEAYGAAYTLQEMLTVKSDDVAGRARIYESIVKGQNVLDAGRPESFNVLMKEMQALGLEVQTINQEKGE